MLVFFSFVFCLIFSQPGPHQLLKEDQPDSPFSFLSAEKPMAQGPPGGVIGILGGVVAIGLIIGVAVTVFMVHRRQQKTRTETDNDLWVPGSHQRILQGVGAGHVARLGVHSCHSTGEKYSDKRGTLFYFYFLVWRQKRNASILFILRVNTLDFFDSSTKTE